MRATMIYVQITRMMRVNRLRRDFADVLLHHSDNVQQRLGVETVIGKPMYGEVLHAQYVGSCLSGGLALDNGFVSAPAFAAGFTICENDDPDLVASENVSADSASVASTGEYRPASARKLQPSRPRVYYLHVRFHRNAERSDGSAFGNEAFSFLLP